MRRKLAEATLTELKLTKDVLEASQPLRHALIDLSAHSPVVKSNRLTNWVINASTEVGNQRQVQDSRVERETRPGFQTGVRSDVATEKAKPNTSPRFVSVPNLTNSNQPSINHPQYSVQPKATQPQPEPTILILCH